MTSFTVLLLVMSFCAIADLAAAADTQVSQNNYRTARRCMYARTKFCLPPLGHDGPGDRKCGGFTSSCRAPFEHRNGFLFATCKASNNRWVDTSIDLDPHISNVNGNMVDGNGYSKTCEGFGIIRSSTEFIVTASCKKFDGTLRKTGFDVSVRISNNGGRLVFNNC